MSIHVFLGPTLPHASARSILRARYHPPVALGDVYRLVNRQAQVVLIVDGYFERVPAVWHKEILFALSRGVAVYGCSSMGALRAAELHPYGMTGIGTVFRAYRDGVYEDDDEVAVAHGPAESGYRRASEAMVDIRHGLREAARGGIAAPSTCAWIEQAAKARFYPDRHWGTLLLLAKKAGLPASDITALREFVLREKPSVKQRDAIEALTALAEQQIPRREAVSFTFEPTNSWYWLERREADAEE